MVLRTVLRLGSECFFGNNLAYFSLFVLKFNWKLDYRQFVSLHSHTFVCRAYLDFCKMSLEL